ncbi:MAG: amidohydrolase family protein [Candidatus Abyssubacteria bacterium]|nr:amidohydrolase family protein [Candidatus Abyssubacteria bacterium]
MPKPKPAKESRPRVIDTHMHINFQRLQSKELAGKIGIRYTPAGLLKDMEESNVVRALLMTVPGMPGVTKKFAEKYPGKFWVAGSVDPKSMTDETLAALEADMAEGAIRAVKLYVGYQHYYPDDEDCVPLYRLLMKYDMPVIFHTGDCVSTMARLKFSHPLNIDELAFRFPDLKIVMAHMGNPWLRDAAEVIYKNENVHADLSGLITGLEERYKKEYRERLLDQLESAIYYCGADHLMFGTDYCLASHADSLEFFSKLRIKKSDMNNFLYKNALKLYGRGEKI